MADTALTALTATTTLTTGDLLYVVDGGSSRKIDFDNLVTSIEGVISVDHGGTTGLADDDHTQYAIISSGAGAPGTTPAREGAVHVDTTADVPYIAVGSASSADWAEVQLVGGAVTLVNSAGAAPTTEAVIEWDSDDDQIKVGDGSGTKVFSDDAKVARLAVASEFTATQNFNATTLTDGATINWDASANQVCSVTLGGNRTMAAPTNLVDGATYVLRAVQDGTGSRTITWNAVFKWPGGTAPTLTTTANATDVLSFVSDGTNLYGVASLDFS